jgi:catechol 2,3-dioxygenase-like lactoylglutathione lyase family enzyme
MTGSLQSISVITLGIEKLARSKRFYAAGFGWVPVFENDEIAFYQMNGLVLGTWLKAALAADMNAPLPVPPGGFALAHNVPDANSVDALIERLLAAGGILLRTTDNPPHGGRRGYVADPDGHAWEVAWNPAWPIDAEGHVRFAI